MMLVVPGLLSCGQANVKPEIADENSPSQTAEITVNGKKFNATEADILTMSYVGQTTLGFVFMSEKNDFQFLISAYLTELKPGTYVVCDCKGPSNCDDSLSQKNQQVLFAPFIKDPMPPLNLSRISYNAPDPGLTPLTLLITSVTDEQQTGIPFKTKRIKGQFNGTLAYAEKQQDYSWKVVGEKTIIAGTFDMYCTVR